MRKKLFATSGILFILAMGCEVFILLIDRVAPGQAPTPVFPDSVHYALLGMASFFGTLYGGARALPGSPEYTPENLRKFDTTLKDGEIENSSEKRNKELQEILSYKSRIKNE